LVEVEQIVFEGGNEEDDDEEEYEGDDGEE
jgi:hypothetical protein